jgi:hypothetical protein
MESNVEEVAGKVKTYAAMHAAILTEGEKKYAPSLVWHYAARLSGWNIRISDVKKQGDYVVATADAVCKAEIVATGKGCATAEDGGTSNMMKVAQQRATNSVLTGLGYVMKAAGFEQVIQEDHIVAPPVVPAPEKAPEAPAPVKKTLEQFKSEVAEFDGKLSLMVEKLNILAEARKEGLSKEEIAELEEAIKLKYASL